MKNTGYFNYLVKFSMLVLSILSAGFVSAKEQAETGKEIYLNDCASCHSGGFKGWVTGAPETGNKPDWVEFEKEGVEKMTEITIKGGDGMDPMGGCKTCSKEQIREAVEYIIYNNNK